MIRKLNKKRINNMLYGLKQNIIGQRSGEIPKERVLEKNVKEVESSVSATDYLENDGTPVWMFSNISAPNTTVVSSSWRDNLVMKSTDGSIDITGTNADTSVDLGVNSTVRTAAISTYAQANTIKLLATTSEISAKTTAATTIYTVPASKTLIVHSIMLRVSSFDAGAKSTQAVYNLGGNSADFNDYISGANYTVASASIVKRVQNAIGTSYPYYPATTNFSIKITTGSDATTEGWIIDLFGYLI